MQDSERNKQENLYVGNISPAVQAVELQQIFAGLGQVLYAKLSEVQDADDKGYAFVYIPNAERAKSAVQTLHGKLLKGERLTVQEMPESPGVVGMSIS